VTLSNKQKVYYCRKNTISIMELNKGTTYFFVTGTLVLGFGHLGTKYVKQQHILTQKIF